MTSTFLLDSWISKDGATTLKADRHPQHLPILADDVL